MSVGNLPDDIRSHSNTIKLVGLCIEKNFDHEVVYGRIVKDCLKEYQGVKFNSVFNKLPDFHVCNPGLPPCWGHDGFEGVIAYDLQLYYTWIILLRRDGFRFML